MNANRFAKLPLDVMQRSDLTPADKIVFAAIEDRIGENGVCWAGLRRLASDCGMSPSTVSGSVDRLEAAGLIAIERAGSNAKRQTNRYRSLRTKAERTNGERTNTERSDIGRTGDERSPDERERSDSERERSDFSTEPDPITRPINQTKGRVRKSAAETDADEWKAARAAMTTNILDTPEFREAWLPYARHRREGGRHKLTPTSRKARIKDCEDMGPARAVAALKHTTANGWTQLIEPDARAARNGNGRAGRIDAKQGKYDGLKVITADNRER